MVSDWLFNYHLCEVDIFFFLKPQKVRLTHIKALGQECTINNCWILCFSKTGFCILYWILFLFKIHALLIHYLLHTTDVYWNFPWYPLSQANLTISFFFSFLFLALQGSSAMPHFNLMKKRKQPWRIDNQSERALVGRLASFFQPLHSIYFFSFFTSNNIHHGDLFCRLLLYALAHMGETNSTLKETIGKYITGYLELQRKTVIHNAPYVPKYAPLDILNTGIFVQHKSQPRSPGSCIIIFL